MIGTQQVQHDTIVTFRILIKSITALLIIAIGSIPLLAQSGGQAGAFSRMGFGPRGMAMGNALTAVTSEGIYSYYNPALAAQARTGNQVNLSTAVMSFDRSLNTVNGTFPLPPTGGITVSLVNANVTDIDGRSIDGYDTGTMKTHEYQIAATLGQQISDNFSAGIGINYYISDLHQDLESATTVGLDIGVLYTISDKLKAGAAIQDLLASYSWDSSTLYGDNSSGRTDQFPTRIQLGLSYHPISKLIVSLNGGRMIHEDQSTNNLKLGTAYRLHKRVTLRGGWQIDNLSAIDVSNHGSIGFSVHLPFDFLQPSVDYAFVQESNNIAYMHTFGIQLNL